MQATEASVRAHSSFGWQQVAKGKAHARTAGELADGNSVDVLSLLTRRLIG